MKILILNGSPKGEKSITLQTALYLQTKHTDHLFAVMHVGKNIKKYERDFSTVRSELQSADLILFVYPVYTFIVPYQLHRLIELIKEDGIELKGKKVSQITTSKHFFDVTAHRFIEENCADLGMNVIHGFSADMEDLLTEVGQKQADDFFRQLMFSCENNIYEKVFVTHSNCNKKTYEVCLEHNKKKKNKDVLIITYIDETDYNLKNMILDFQNTFCYSCRVINLKDFDFAGGCLGCLECTISGKCIYKDGFEEYLKEYILNADAFIYAFSIKNHYAHSTFKCFDDRQFCNGHRTLSQDKPVAYIISGDYKYENNLRMIIEARSEVGGNYLCGIATDEDDTSVAIKSLARNIEFSLENNLSRPKNFYGVGGTKIFRDLIFLMQGMMKEDHQFYKNNKIYDFPQNNMRRIIQLKILGKLLEVPAIGKNIKGKMNDAMLLPYRKIVENKKEEKL